MNNIGYKSGAISGADAPVRYPEVSSARDSLATNISDYVELVRLLDEKLSCIMRPSVPENVGVGAPDYRCSFAADLQNCSNIVLEKNNLLRDMLDRLEI